MARRSTRKKKIQKVSHAIVYIHSTFNNTILTVTTPEGQVLAWASSGTAGFKGTKKGTPFAAQQAADMLARRMLNDFSIKTISIKTRGPGSGRDAAIKTLQATGLKVVDLQDVTPIPHNGCRPKKAKRG